MVASEPFKGFADPVFAIFLSFSNMNYEHTIIFLNNIATLKPRISGPEPVNT